MIKRTRKPVSRQTRRFESRGIRRRFNEAEESNVFYKASNASFEVFEDDPEDGMGDYVNGYDLPCSCTAKTLEELFNKVKSKLYMDDKDFYWMIDRDSSSFRVSYTGNNDSEVASKYEIAAWKKGEEQLYIIDGFISVKKVMGEIDVPEDEMEELARKTNTELN